jgi:iron(III) transport system substrate-binding protein
VAAIVFNEAEAKKLGIPKPETWADLTKPIYKGKVVMPHPLSSGTGFLDVSAWLQAFGEAEGWKFMDGLHENIWRYTHSGSQPATLAARGEAVVGIAFDIRAARELAQGAPVAIVFPAKGLGWEMNAFAVVKGAPHLEAAKKLADWAASDAAMQMYAETRAVAARPEFSKPVKNLPTNLADLLMVNDFAWARFQSRAHPGRVVQALRQQSRSEEVGLLSGQCDGAACPAASVGVDLRRVSASSPAASRIG